MTHDSSTHLFSLGLSPHFPGEDSSLRWWVVSSLALHVLILFFFTTLRPLPTVEQPLRAHDVTLISLPNIETLVPKKPTSPTPPPKKVAKRAPKVAPVKAKPAPPPPKPKEVVTASPPPPKPKEVVTPPLPPLSTQTAPERLSDSFSGAVKSVTVPNQLTPVPSEPHEAVITPSTSIKSPSVFENLTLPTSAPKLAKAKRLPPQKRIAIPELTPKTSAPSRPTSAAKTTSPAAPTKPTIQEETQKALQAIKSPPTAPSFKEVQPFQKTEPKDSPSPSSPKISNTVKQKLQSIKVPTSPVTTKKVQKKKKAKVPVAPVPQELPTLKAPQLAKAIPERQSTPSLSQPKRERLADSLKEVLNTVKIPKLREVSPITESVPKPVTPAPRPAVKPAQRPAIQPSLPPEVKPLPTPVPEVRKPIRRPDHARTEKLKTQIDQQLAKLKIPKVAPLESIKKRLQVNVVAVGEPDPGLSSPTSQKSSKASSGQNRYLALVENRIDEQWVAPPISIDQRHLQAEVKFRILRSGKITKVHIQQGSGNAYYDSAALRAVQASDPLPSFPKDLTQQYLDVRYKFSLGDTAS